MVAITANEAKKNFESLAAKVVSDADPLVITLESGAQLVLMPLEDFSAWQETAYLLSSPANAEQLRTSIHEARLGNVMEKQLIEP